MRLNHSLSLCFLSFICAAHCRADWYDNHWQFRRTIDVNWDAGHSSGHDLAMVQFYTAGHAAADGSDIRVARADGRLVASHLLRAGPGDRFSVVFALVPGETSYAVYFGNADPAPPPPGMEDVPYHCGLLLEMRQANSPRVNAIGDFPAAWEQAGPVVGRTLVGQPFYGVNPFGEYQRVMTRLSGWLAVPVDGEYYFSGSVTGRGAIFLDGKPALFMANHVGDQRFNATLHLDRGGYEFVLYHYQPGGEDIVSIVWKRPDMSKAEVMPRQVFGTFGRGRAGALEEMGHSLVADFEAQYLAEYELGGNYSHRYQLTAQVPSGGTCEWDFGNAGGAASGNTLEHVFVTAGIYPIRLTVHWNGNTDVQTIRLPVDRDWDNVDQAQLDPLLKQARVIAGYDVTKVGEAWLPWMIQIEEQALMTVPAVAAAQRLAGLPRHANATTALIALRQVSGNLETSRKFDDALRIWDAVPPESDLNPMAACYEAGVLDWSMADFPRALKVLAPYAKSTNPPARLSYAMALVLADRAAEAAPIFDSLQANQEKLGANLGAVSGAMARTIEYRIAQRDWENGEQDWDAWQTRCPAAFVEGYSVLLRTKFVEQHAGFLAAAKIAEAFADAVPASPYSPELLDRASRLLMKADPAKSKALRDELKAKYPEDPLSQE